MLLQEETRVPREHLLCLAEATYLVCNLGFDLSSCHAYDFSDYRWQALLEASAARKEQLLKSQDKYKKVEDMYLLFAKKASAFNSWFENAEEDLTDPVRCNSVEEIMVRRFLCISFKLFSL